LPNIGLTELLIILAIALMVIGPKKLPDLGRQFGRAIREFRKAGATVQKELGLDEVADDVRGLRDDVQKARDSVNVRKQLGLDDLGPLDLEAETTAPPTPAAEAAAPYGAPAVETAAAASVATAATAAADTAPPAAVPETATIAETATPAAAAPAAGEVIAAPAASSDADAAGDDVHPPVSDTVAEDKPAPKKRRRTAKPPADPPLEADAP
jgi:TatA/E family protein of Tat protein translocase